MMAGDQFNKADGGKTLPTLVEKDCARALAMVMRTTDYGVEKYAARSWKTVEMERYDDAARRHRQARDLGETCDPESGLYHMAHEIICLLFQLQTELEKLSVDEFKAALQYNKPPRAHRGDA